MQIFIDADADVARATFIYDRSVGVTSFADLFEIDLWRFAVENRFNAAEISIFPPNHGLLAGLRV